MTEDQLLDAFRATPECRALEDRFHAARTEAEYEAVIADWEAAFGAFKVAHGATPGAYDATLLGTEIVDDLVICDSYRKDVGRIVLAAKDGHADDQALDMLRRFAIEDLDERFVRMRGNIRKLCGFSD